MRTALLRSVIVSNMKAKKSMPQNTIIIGSGFSCFCEKSMSETASPYCKRILPSLCTFFKWPKNIGLRYANAGSQATLVKMTKGRTKNSRNGGQGIAVFLQLINPYTYVGYWIPGCSYHFTLVIILLKSVLRDIFK